MSRINKLEKLYQEPLKEKDIKDTSVFIQSILNADITKGKYARFLIEAFLNEKFLKEDLVGGLDSTIGQAISLFHKHKSKLPMEYRSIYALDKETQIPLYQSPGDLWNSVKQFQDELSGKELKKEEQEKIYRETEFIYKDEVTGFQIISPLTEESAKWWGKGTRWCTSADNDNMFENYVKEAPLFILLMPDKQKLQLWTNYSYIQFMDEADNDVSLEYIEQHWHILEKILFFTQNIKYIPEKYRTDELYRKTLINLPDFHIPKLYPELIQTKETAIELSKKIFRYDVESLPVFCRTKEFFRDECYHLPDNLHYHFSSDEIIEICLSAIERDPNSYTKIPYNKLTIEHLKKAFSFGADKAYIPSHIKVPVELEVLFLNNVKDNYYPVHRSKYFKSKHWIHIIKQKPIIWNDYIYTYPNDELNIRKDLEQTFKQLILDNVINDQNILPDIFLTDEIKQIFHQKTELNNEKLKKRSQDMLSNIKQIMDDLPRHNLVLPDYNNVA